MAWLALVALGIAFWALVVARASKEACALLLRRIDHLQNEQWTYTEARLDSEQEQRIAIGKVETLNEQALALLVSVTLALKRSGIFSAVMNYPALPTADDLDRAKRVVKKLEKLQGLLVMTGRLSESDPETISEIDEALLDVRVWVDAQHPKST